MTRRSRNKSKRLSRRNNLDRRIGSEAANKRDQSYSASYEAGKTVQYNYRIHGPVTPVTTSHHSPSCSIFDQESCNCE
jgi:hypothetical protein